MSKRFRGIVIVFLALCFVSLVLAYPFINIISPENKAYNMSTIEFNVSINETGSCNYSLDFGENNVTMDSIDGFNFNYTNASMIDNNYTATFFCSDGLGGIINTNISFTVDTILPSINIISPTNNIYNNATLLVNITSNDTNLDKIWFYNGTGNETYTNPVYRTFNEGNNTLQAWANDTAGNTNYTNITFNIDALSPSITFESPTPSNGSTVNSSTQTITANISDDSNANTSSWIDFDRSLIGYWSMDSYNTTGVYDNSTYGNFGTFNGGLGTSNISTAVRGKGITFDGINNYISINGSNIFKLYANASYSFSTWIKPNSFDQYHAMLGISGPTYYFIAYVHTSTDANWNVTKGIAVCWDTGGHTCAASQSNVLDTSKYSHVVITYNGSRNMNNRLRIYIDGVDSTIQLTNTSTVADINTTNIYLGGDEPWISTEAFNGSMDEAMMFNRELSSQEVAALYNSNSNKFNATFNNLSNNQHNYTVYAIDEGGNINNSGQRNFIVNSGLNCGVLSIAGTDYNLTSNVFSNETCFTITAQNIILDCQGNWITYSTAGGANAYGVYTNQYNTTIKNCNIIDGNWTGGSTDRYGIFFDTNDNSTLMNNFVNVSNTSAIYLSYADFSNVINNTAISNSTGIWQYSSSNNIIINNFGTGNSNYGIAFYEYSVNNTIINNTGTSNSSYGILIGSHSTNNNLTNNTGMSDSGTGIRLSSSPNNTIISQTAIGLSAGSRGVYIDDTSHNVIVKDCNNITAVLYDIYVGAGSLNASFINCSYNLSKEHLDGDAELNRMWYFDANITNSTNSALANANVTIYNSSSAPVNSQLTNSSGNIIRAELVEYINYGNVRTYNTPHVVNVTKSGYTINTTNYNLTALNNVFATIKLLESPPDTTPPTINFTSNTDASGLIVNRGYILINVTANDTYLNNITINIYNSTFILINTTISLTNDSFINYTVPRDGIYYFNATAYDQSNNSNSTETLNITIDTIAPQIIFNYPTSNSITTNISDITINITANDTHFINSTIYLYNSVGSLIFNQTKNISENVIASSGLSDGTYYYNATAYDSAGNKNSTLTRSIIIDTSTPSNNNNPGSGGGGSGGGGGGEGGVEINASTNVEENITPTVSFSQYWPNIINGTRTVNIDKAGMPIIQIILITNNYTNIANTLKITSQPNNPSTENISALIYTYILIDTTNLEQKYVDNISLKFKVDKNWLARNNLTASNITIYNYDTNWSNASASKYSEDSTYVYYSINGSKLNNMAIGGPIIPIIEPAKENITLVEQNTTSTPTEPNNITSDLTQKGFLRNVWNAAAGAVSRIYNKIISVQLSKESKSLIVVAISSILTLILGVVTGVLVYRNATKPKRIRRMYNKKIVTGRIMPYAEEPPLTQTSITTPQPPQPVLIRAEKIPAMPSEIPTSQDPEFYVRKISELLLQCEYALDNGKIEDAKNYYTEARAIYFHSDIDYEHKARVYDKIISLHGRLNK